MSQETVQWLIPSQDGCSAVGALGKRGLDLWAGPRGGAGRGLERGGARSWAVSACQKAAADPQAPGARSSVPTLSTRCGPGTGEERGPQYRD